jgi:serine/threonine protein kinase
MLRTLSHRNIGPPILAAFHDATRTMRIDGESRVYFVSELCPLGALREVSAIFLKSQEAEWPLKVRLARDVANGLSYLHDQNIIHRDLKTVNVVIDSNFTAKICDFHSAVYMYSASVRRVLSGTSEFLAPEVATNRVPAGLSSDVFSFGICLCELICGAGSEKDTPEFFRRSERHGYALDKQDVRIRADKKCPHALLELAFGCCQTDPNQRPSALTTVAALSSIFDQFVGDSDFTVPEAPSGSKLTWMSGHEPLSPTPLGVISYREGNVIENAGDSQGHALTLKEATMTVGMSNRMDEMMRELKQLRVEKEEYRQQLDSERDSNEQMLDEFESKYQDLDGNFKTQQQVNSELANRLELLERMYTTTRSELNEAKGAFSPLAANSHQGGIVGNKIPTMMQAVAVSRTHTGTSAAEKFSSWKKTLRGVPDEDGNSVSMLWDAHTDLGTRIDELVQACMTGRAYASLGEDILRNRVLAQVEEVAREYNETVISGLEDCSSIIDRALQKLEVPIDEQEEVKMDGSEDISTLEALTPAGPGGAGLFDDDETASGVDDTMLDTVGDGADVSDGETILSGMDMSSVAPPSYAAPPPPNVEQATAAKVASLEASLKATSLKAFLSRS